MNERRRRCCSKFSLIILTKHIHLFKSTAGEHSLGVLSKRFYSMEQFFNYAFMFLKFCGTFKYFVFTDELIG